MTSMPALSLHQPWAQLLVTRQPCDCPQTWLDGHRPGDHARTHPMAKWIETRSWPCPEKYRGQRMAFHATARRPEKGFKLGPYSDWGRDGDTQWMRYDRDDGFFWSIRLPRRAVVGSGIVTASLPIRVDYTDHGHPAIVVPSPPMSWTGAKLVPGDGSMPTDVSDQLPYGDFTPGRWAWIIEDAAPTTERCPWCWGTGKSHGSCDACLDARSKLVYAGPGLPDRRVPCPDCCTPDGEALPCPVCNGKTITDPIPARGHQRVWPWTPQQLEAA